MGRCVTGTCKGSVECVFKCGRWLVCYLTTQTQSICLRVTVIDADGWTLSRTHTNRKSVSCTATSTGTLNLFL